MDHVLGVQRWVAAPARFRRALRFAIPKPTPARETQTEEVALPYESHALWAWSLTP